MALVETRRRADDRGMGRLVRDIMVTEVVTLRPEDSVSHAISVLIDHDIGGAPVVDDDGRPVGLLSDGDLVVRQGYLHVPSVYSLFLERGQSFPPPSVVQFDIELRKALGATVAEVMDPSPVTCREDESVEDIATRMLDHGVRRLPVVRHGRLVGIVARGDLLRLLAPSSGDPPPA